MPKTVVEKFSFSELKIQKVKLLTHNLTKFYCIFIFNVGGCLASYLTFRLFVKLDLVAYKKKNVYSKKERIEDW